MDLCPACSHLGQVIRHCLISSALESRSDFRCPIGIEWPIHPEIEEAVRSRVVDDANVGRRCNDKLDRVADYRQALGVSTERRRWKVRSPFVKICNLSQPCS